MKTKVPRITLYLDSFNELVDVDNVFDVFRDGVLFTCAPLTRRMAEMLVANSQPMYPQSKFEIRRSERDFLESNQV